MPIDSLIKPGRGILPDSIRPKHALASLGRGREAASPSAFDSSRHAGTRGERKVEFTRPRDLEITYSKEFGDIVHELRGHIHQARQ